MIALLPFAFASLQASPIPAAAGDSEARLHPADAVVVVEIPDVQALLAAYSQAPLVQMVGDEQVRSTVLDVLDSFEIDLVAEVEKALLQAGLPASVAAEPMSALMEELERVGSASFSISVDAARAGLLAKSFAMRASATVAMQRIEGEITTYENEHGALAGLDTLELGPELERDPWGHAYVLFPDAEPGQRVVSLGADGEAGGEGEALDLDSTYDLAAYSLSELPHVVGLLATCRFDSEESAVEVHAVLRALVDRAGADGADPVAFDWGDGQGELVALRHAETPDVPAWLARAGERIALGAGAAAALELSARAGDATLPSAQSSFYGAITQALPPATGTTVLQIGIGSMTSLDLVREAVEEASRAAVGGAGDIDRMLKSLGQGAGALRMQLAGERFVTDLVARGLEFGEHNVSKLVACKPLPASLWPFVPPDAVAVGATTLDGPRMYRALVAALGESGHDEAPEKLAEMESRFGFSLERDVFGGLGDAAVGYLLPIKGLMGLPEMALAVELRDREAFTRGLEGLLAVLEEQSAGELTVRNRPYRNTPIWTFGFDQESGAQQMVARGFSPSLTIVGDTLVVTLSSLRAKREIKRAMAEKPGVHPLTAEAFRPPPSASAYVYLDWAKLVDGLYEAGRGMLGLMSAFAGESGPQIPFDAAALPEATTFTRFFEPTVSWYLPEEGGGRIHIESSFGPETWLGLGAVGAGAFLGVRRAQVSAVEEFEEVVEVQPEGSAEELATHDALRFLTARLAVHHLELARFPATLEDLEDGDENYPNGFLDGGVVPIDGWGRSFVYSRTEDGYTLHSVGGDGVDQGGAGDDILAY